MGLDITILNFLRYIRLLHGDFGNTVTLGRQEVHTINPKLVKLYGDMVTSDIYAESILTNEFGSINVDSIDYSNFEGASIIHDLNTKIPGNLHDIYDTLIDAGTLEHVFDVKNALENSSKLIKEGGTIIHVLPANNFNGHGFYQFSPDLFFQYYSEENGYLNTKVFIANLSVTKYWWHVKKTNNDDRHNIMSLSNLYIMVVTKKCKNTSSRVFQTDYLDDWQSLEYKGNIRPSSKIRTILKKNRTIHNFYDNVLIFLGRFSILKNHYTRNSYLKKVSLSKLLNEEIVL